MTFDPITPLPARRYDEPRDASPRSRGVALVLSVLVGWFGAHRFYVGKTGTGVLQALTLGGLGLWTCYDIILVAAGAFRDANGRRIANWGEEETPAAGSVDARRLAMLLEEVELNRGEIADLAERVDFVERMLARQRDRDRLPGG
ncbi:MAG TPA: TM2 domain-containing protein [Gemmatimonadales bacterium]|jgi:TM2 domain-containing membrane protein YozV